MISLLGVEKFTGITIKKTELGENRNYAVFPKLSEVEFLSISAKLEAYYNDNLPLRNQIIYKYRKLWKGCTNTGEGVIIGKDEQVFLGMSHYKWLSKTLPLEVLYGKTVYLLGKKVFWDLNSADYFVYLAPMKASLYPELLPEWAKNGKNHPDLFIKFVRAKLKDSDYITDLTKILNDKKTKEILFFNKNENVSHWNGNALDIFYKHINSNLQDKPYYTNTPNNETYKLTMDKVNGGIADDNENIPWIHINKSGLTLLPVKYSYSHAKWKSWAEVDIIENDSVNKGVILLATDSYVKATHQDHIQGSFGNIFPIAHNFHYYIHTHYDRNSLRLLTDIINDFHPDTVIEEFVIRKITNSGVSQTNREFYIIGEMKLNEPQLFITPATLNNNFIIINADKNVVDLPRIMPNKDGRVCVMAKINSSIDGKAMLYYKQSSIEEKYYDTIEQDIKKGENYLYMQIYGKADKEFKLKLGFSKEGEYTFYPKPTIEEMCSTAY